MIVIRSLAVPVAVTLVPTITFAVSYQKKKKEDLTWRKKTKGKQLLELITVVSTPAVVTVAPPIVVVPVRALAVAMIVALLIAILGGGDREEKAKNSEGEAHHLDHSDLKEMPQQVESLQRRGRRFLS